ncbi:MULTISPECIES: hypothetical protein [Rhizobium]|uniref:hypothetical protein n=1 Tax=Rhizobium TaxID=379 RepID=UPI000A85CB18|nr:MULTISPECIES: hypothetical protein [Rhizobium]
MTSGFPGIFQSFGDRHGSAVMTPDGVVRARLYSPDVEMRIRRPGHGHGYDISYWWSNR